VNFPLTSNFIRRRPDKPPNSLNRARFLGRLKQAIGDLIRHLQFLWVKRLRVDVERGANVAVSELRLHLGRMPIAFVVGRETAPQNLEAGVECHTEFLGNRIEAQP